VSLTINTNLPALFAALNLSETDDSLSTATERLSTGLRINSAEDDPAGLIVSQGMQQQISGIGEAVSNLQDAVNMAKTADGAINEVATLLKSAYSLAVEAANSAAETTGAAEANQTQLQSIITSIDQIASTTTYGTLPLLNGTAGLSASVTDAADIQGVCIGSTVGTSTVTAGPVTVVDTGQASPATTLLSQAFGSASSVVTNVGSFVINGHAFISDGTETLSSLVSTINSASASTGVTAEVVGPVTGEYYVELTANNYGSNYNFTYYDPSGVLNDVPLTNINNGENATCDVAVTTTSGVVTVPFTGGQNAGDTGLQLTDAQGNSLILTQAGNYDLTSTPTEVAVLDGDTVQFQIGSNADQSVQYVLPDISASSLGTTAVAGVSFATVDVTTQSGATQAMEVINSAIEQVAQMQAALGSFQSNLLDPTSTSLNVAQENLTSSMSDITDTDVATEMTTYTQLQLLEQSGIAVLAQANKQPQYVLQLLQ
jgi:flagellin